MKFLKFSLVLLLSVGMTGVISFTKTPVASAQSQSTALERGYRTGYSDGFSAGIGDATTKAARNYQNKVEYQRADRSFNDVWGPIEDYRDGYQQGFETGYNSGFDNKQFDSTIPSGLRRRPAGASNSGVNTTATAEISADAPPVPESTATVDTQTATVDNSGQPINTNGAIVAGSIPRNTTLSLELLTPLSSDATQRNDPFRAKVTAPAEFADYIVEGRVSEVKRPGKVKGVAHIQLTFEQIRTPDNRVASLRAELVEITPMSSASEVEVDKEGGIKGRDSTKDDAAKVGAASGVGAIIGAIAGGGKGAAIGAIIGGGAGTGAVMTQRGRDIRLDQGQQMRIRTSADTGVL